MNELKITTSYIDGKLANVVLNGEDISSKVTGLTLEMKGGKIPKALIEFPLSEVEVDGNFEVVKNISKKEEAISKVNLFGSEEEIVRKV